MLEFYTTLRCKTSPLIVIPGLVNTGSNDLHLCPDAMLITTKPVLISSSADKLLLGTS